MNSPITQDDLFLFNEGTHLELYHKLGARELGRGQGTYFAVWAPNARAVHVMGDFNGWSKKRDATDTPGQLRNLGGRPARCATGKPVQILHRLASHELLRGQDGSIRIPRRNLAPHRLDCLGP